MDRREGGNERCNFSRACTLPCINISADNCEERYLNSKEKK